MLIYVTWILQNRQHILSYCIQYFTFYVENLYLMLIHGASIRYLGIIDPDGYFVGTIKVPL